MKKILMALFASAVAASVATAGIGITWTTQNWGEYHDGGGSAILAANDALWQLIYAGVDNQIDQIDNSAPPMASQAAWAGNNYLRPGGDDQVLASRIIPMGGGTAADGTIWDEWLTGVIGTADPVFQDLSWTTAGFVYQRVFESSTPLAGSTYFYQTALLALDTTFAGGTSTPQDFFVDPASGPFIPNAQPYAVPEPATMGLLGLGALVMAVRRRRS